MSTSQSLTDSFGPRAWDQLPISPVGKKDLVSIIIPCYNQASYLTEAIESGLQQNYPHIELIVVDDGSPDCTAQVVSSYPGVRYFRQNNVGVSVARNTGLMLSNGEYVLFLDGDDRLLPAAVQTGVDMLAANQELAFVFAPFLIIDSSGSRCGRYHIPSIDQDPYVQLLQHNFIGSPGNVVFHRWVFSAVGGFDPSIDAAADYDLYLRVARSFKIAWHHEAVLEYRRHDSSMSRNSARMLKACLNVLRKQSKHVEGNKQLEEAYRSGRKKWKLHYGEQAIYDIEQNLKSEGKLVESLRSLLLVFRYYPERFQEYVVKRLKRLLEQT